MPRDRGEIQVAALGYFPHRAGAPTLGDAGEEPTAKRIAQRLEETGYQQVIKCFVSGGGEPGRARSSSAFLAYLHHDASISPFRRRHGSWRL